MSQSSSSQREGLAYGLAAYLSWGVLPAYWHLLKAVPAAEILCHRIVWSVLFLGAMLAIRSRGRELLSVLRDWKRVRLLLCTGLLIGSNWILYIWAVNNGHMIEASLGYFINPLVSVLLGTLALRERLKPLQWGAMAVAALGVLSLTLRLDSFPWVSLALAVTFAIYGLMRKTIDVDSLLGLSVESILLAPLALAYLVFLHAHDEAVFPHSGVLVTVLLMGAGAVTALPLLWFTQAARRLSLSAVGVLQFVAPTCAFLLAVFVYGEEWTPPYQIAFACIWTALVLYSVSAWRTQHGNSAPQILSAEP